MATRTTGSLTSLNIGDICGVLYLSQMSYDWYTNDLLYLSFVGYKTAVDQVYATVMRQSEQCLVKAGYYGTCYKRKNYNYVMETTKQANSDIVHATIFLKDKYNINKNDEEFTLYLYVKALDPNKEARLKELLYDKLSKYCSVPVLPEWIDHIYSYMTNNSHLRKAETYMLDNVEEIEVYRVLSNQTMIMNIISEGLQSGDLNINGSNEPSVMLTEDTGLNDYLSLFGSLLANKIQQKFEPKFVPGSHKFSPYLNTLDDYIHHKGIELYAAQLAVIQANANNFNKNKHGFIVGEMGSGVGRFQYLK